MRSVLWALAIVLIARPALSEPLPDINSPAEMARVHEMLIKANEEAARMFQKQLPKKVDRITTLNSVLVANLRLIYYYSLDLTEHAVDMNKMKLLVTEDSCNDRVTAIALRYGSERQYVYFGSDGKMVGNFVLDKNSCS